MPEKNTGRCFYGSEIFLLFGGHESLVGLVVVVDPYLGDSARFALDDAHLLASVLLVGGLSACGIAAGRRERTTGWLGRTLEVEHQVLGFRTAMGLTVSIGVGDIHLARAIEKPVHINVRNFFLDGIHDIQGRTRPAIEDAAQRSGSLLKEVSKNLLGHVLILHDEFYPFVPVHNSEKRGLKGHFLRFYKGKPFI